MTCSLCGGDPHARVATSWSFRVNRDAPTQNVMGNNRGGGRWAYKKERQEWLRWILIERPCIPEAEAKRRVTITRCYSGNQKLRDHGNLVGGLKPVVDALVLSGTIKDDSPHWVEIYYHQRRVERHERCTLFTVEELA